MGKRVWIMLLVAAVFLAAGFWAYRRYKVREPVLPGPAPTAETPRSAAPAGRATAKGPEASPPAAGENKTVEPPSFSPRAGEILDFAANVTKLDSTVANLTVKVAEHRNFNGESAWHLQAFAHTENPYRMVFELDDQFDSYSEASNLHSLQYEMHLSERGQKADSVERIVTSGKDPAPPDAAAARVLPGTRDPLGLLMFLRGVDWSRTSEVRSPVFDGHKLYDVRAVLVAKDQKVSVTSGKFTTTKIEIHVLDNGSEMKDAHFLLYIAEVADRLPVLMEAVLPVATVRVELTKVR
ncbi:MAG TPA: DUF3108 domain-containing protein [Terriglobales bacterium]|nr:DUF3108 domain-containing protein [Terriglobales bacterium]